MISEPTYAKAQTQSEDSYTVEQRNVNGARGKSGYGIMPISLIDNLNNIIRLISKVLNSVTLLPLDRPSRHI